MDCWFRLRFTHSLRPAAINPATVAGGRNSPSIALVRRRPIFGRESQLAQQQRQHGSSSSYGAVGCGGGVCGGGGRGWGGGDGTGRGGGSSSRRPTAPPPALTEVAGKGNAVPAARATVHNGNKGATTEVRVDPPPRTLLRRWILCGNDDTF